MMGLYGFVGLIWIITLFKRKWKLAGILFVIILILTPFATKSEAKESAKNYEQGMEYIKNEDYDKAEELLKKVKKEYSDNYDSAQEELKKIRDKKAEPYVLSAESKFNNSDYDGAKSDLSKALNISKDYQRASDLLNKVTETAEANEKAKQELAEQEKKKAEEEAKQPISTDFRSFEVPYSKMTDLQKDDYYKTIKGKYVQWSGNVVDVDKHTIGVICLDSTLTMDFVAIADNIDTEQLKSIQKGSKITIKGKISQQEGSALPWALNDCTIIQ